jgi:hypothetical protein
MVIANPLLWVNITIPFMIGVFLVFSKIDYTPKEFAIQFSVTFVFLFIVYLIAFGTTANLFHKVYYNTSVNSITYYEAWDEEVHYTEEECSGTGNKKSCTTVYRTRIDHHPKYWELVDNLNGSMNVDESDYIKARNKYGAKKEYLHHSGQVSYGDGNAFKVTVTDIVPHVQTHEEVNYVKAVKYNIVKSETFPKKIEAYKKSGQLLEYPSIMLGDIGNYYIERVLKAKNVLINDSNMTKQLEEYASIAGSSKQVNPLVYIVKNQSPEFTEVLKAYWVNGSKNDAILILNINDDNIITWSDTISWTKNPKFLVQNQTIYTGLNINDPKVTELFISQIQSNFKRVSMKEYEYLKNNIDLSITAELVIIVINLILSGIVFFYFSTQNPFNSTKNYGENRWR